MASANVYLSWICQELCIEPDITLQETDVGPNGYVNIHFLHFDEIGGGEFAQDFEKLLGECFKHVKVTISDNEEGKLGLHITFKLDHIKTKIYNVRNT